MTDGLRARGTAVPLLDHRLVEWSFRLPSNFKPRGNTRQSGGQAWDGTHLSRDLLYAPKHGFNVPMKSSLEGETEQLRPG
jgi:hypothetical protein